jgi:hypothetical protein
MARLWISAVAAMAIGDRPADAAEPLIRAAVVDGRAYVAPLANLRAGEPRWKESGGYFTLLGRDPAAPDKTVILRLPDVVEGEWTAPVLHRWQIDRKQVHFLVYGGFNNPGAHAFQRRSHLVSRPLDLVTKLTVPVAETLADPARRREWEQSGSSADAGPPEWQYGLLWRVTGLASARVSFDFLPAANGQFEWYGSEPDGGHNRVTRWDSQAPAKTGGQNKWTEVGIWKIDSGDSLFVTAAGEDRCFVTEAGRVFAAPQKAKAGTPLKEIWVGKPPVDVLLHDSDSAKWYAFTKDQYFEVADPIKPRPHTLTIGRAAKAEEAIETAAKCARVIRGLPEPKKK